MNGDLVVRLREQLERAARLPFYEERFRAAGFKPAELRSLDDFQQLPLLARAELRQDLRERAPFGGLYHEDAVRVTFTLSPEGLFPIYFSQRDIALQNTVNAELLRLAGVRENDFALTTLAHAILPAGLLVQGGFEALGAKVIAAGPGEAERAAELARRFGVTVLYTNPSFALRLAEAGVRGIRVLIAGGEPLSSVPGLRDRVRKAIRDEVRDGARDGGEPTEGGGPILVDSYGLAECVLVARQCHHEGPLHVADSFVYVEIVDVESGKPVAPGEVGEVVVTHLDKDVSPMVRLRTGDLAALGRSPCPCGHVLSFVNGIVGRVDEMRKVKGIKFYPSQIRRCLDTLEPLRDRHYRVVLRRGDAGSDHIELEIEGAEELMAAVRLTELIKRELMISVNAVRFVPEWVQGPALRDEREQPFV